MSAILEEPRARAWRDASCLAEARARHAAGSRTARPARLRRGDASLVL